MAAKHGERVLETPGNPISVGFTLSTLSPQDIQQLEQVHSVTSSTPSGDDDDDDDDDCTFDEGVNLDTEAAVDTSTSGCSSSGNDVAKSKDTPDDTPQSAADTGNRDVPGAKSLDVTFLGSMLFARNISGRLGAVILLWRLSCLR